MNWYLSKIVYRIVCGEGEHPAQFEEQLRVLSACNEDEALDKAYTIGHNEQFAFKNHNGHQVEWRFVNVCELIKISDWVDGAELYSTINEIDDADAYTNLVNDKSATLLQKQSRKALNLI